MTWNEEQFARDRAKNKDAIKPSTAENKNRLRRMVGMSFWNEDRYAVEITERKKALTRPYTGGKKVSGKETHAFFIQAKAEFSLLSEEKRLKFDPSF